MKAVVISKPGPPEVLMVADRPDPAVGEREVLIRVKAAGVNRADVGQRQGRYPAPAGVAADIPGLEVAGIVEACGRGVARWRPGDAVCALLPGAGYAERAAVDERHCLPVPSVDFAEAAALPEVLFTVWSNVFQRGRLRAGETFLVHGGTSGIGLAALQLAKLFGARAWATAGSDEKCRACERAGADRAINYRTTDFVGAFGHESVDVILDMVGGDYVAKNIALLRPEGRLVFINTMQGAKAEVDFRAVMARRLTLTGSTLRTREPEFKAAVAAELERQVWPLVVAGKFKAQVWKTFPFGEAAAAHRLMESSEHRGKIVLIPERAD
ncbi:NAD(P)H-quinone oxidoreductase [Horticoccus luteus]|uniref:NAD(P)H-quinone oxidoreductase n=1 Tax=Horticoccus luteus TaxID=2862869 RepID=A0A8F9TX68_9BACT|nr:NAD(P)H-quinone oxidoreductase [Horticoccus luteus]QYM79187.1 NAD(P)H-quinone oxidoreductase [Horticoccus luteus]